MALLTTMEVEEGIILLTITRPERRNAGRGRPPPPSVGPADHRIGATPCAGVQVNEDDLIHHVRTHLSAFKAPKQVFFVAHVPRTPVSKVDKPASTELALRLSGDAA